MFRQHFLIAIVHAMIVAGKGIKSKPEFDASGDAMGQLIVADSIPAVMISFKATFFLCTGSQMVMLDRRHIRKRTADTPYWQSFALLIYSLTTLLVYHILEAVAIAFSYKQAAYGEHFSNSLFVALDTFGFLTDILMIITLLTLLAYFRQHYGTTLSWDMPKQKPKFIFDVAVLALQAFAAIGTIAMNAAKQTYSYGVVNWIFWLPKPFFHLYVTTLLIASLDVAGSAFILKRALKINNDMIDPGVNSIAQLISPLLLIFALYQTIIDIIPPTVIGFLDRIYLADILVHDLFYLFVNWMLINIGTRLKYPLGLIEDDDSTV
ncbi:hypothetical protein BDN72DRAFT_903868 [Pluteus cervinus]|uniref:Uncharacterized protein n=1 Tax=Pluteus cervinus TaxID=181527 RepID=A0ACD3A7N0_9AGAR|nr:hypothetical protein BDN72DRAFT_903868 [Pluteus cervinus]